MYPMLKSLLGILFLIYPIMGYTLPSDKTEKMHVDAASSQGDLKKNIITHTGNVVAIQGTTKLTGDVIVVYLSPQNELIKGIATGKPATYKTLPAENKPEFYAEGDEIHYLVEKQLILLIGNAKVIQGENTYEGHRLEYQIDTEVVTSPKSPPGYPQGRASMVITPKALTEAKKP
jgi:lipopolysaccharide export system protein LptA